MLAFDHVAIAARSVRPILQFVTGTLGGVVISGGAPPGAGFRAVQVRIGRRDDGMTVELLEPWHPEHNDFLARFLEHTGDGPHHLTYKTPNIAAELERFRAVGFDPVGVDFSNEFWREFFVHPRQSHGPVIQVAQPGMPSRTPGEAVNRALAGDVPDWSDVWWSEADTVVGTAAAVLRRVVIGTPDVEAGAAFYGDVLGADLVEVPAGVEARWGDGMLLLERADVVRPQVERLEVEGALWDVTEVGGTRFVPV